MTSLIIALVLVLVLITFFLVFRLQALISVAKGSERRAGTSNKINGFLMLAVPLVGLFLLFWYTGVASENFLPEAASEHGVITDNLFWISIYIITAMFIVTNAALFWFAYRYQYQEGRKAWFYPHNDTLEVIWTIVPAIILTVLVFFGWRAWSDIMEVDPPKNAQVIEIMGKQFAWQVRYPGKDQKLGPHDYRLIDDVAGNEFGIDFEKKASEDDFIAREMHIPVNKPILLKIRARDVLHSVFAPHFRLKMDAVPGMPTQFFFTPTKTTAQMRQELGNPDFNYEIACTEVCGKGHFAMKYLIVVEEEEEYKKWYASQEPFLKKNPEFKNRGMKWLIEQEKKAQNKGEDKKVAVK